MTNHRVYREPTPPQVALDFCQTVLSAPSAVRIRSGREHWRIFESLCRNLGARGNVVPDAYLAAMAIEAGATFITMDAGFAPGAWAWHRPTPPFSPRPASKSPPATSATLPGG